MPGPLISFSVIYSLAFLLPGFVAYKLMKRVGRITVEADRFDKAIYTVGASGLSLSAALILYSAWEQSPQIAVPDSYTLVEIATIYVLSLMSSIVIGAGVGKVYYWYVHGKTDARRHSAWELAYEHREEPVWVRVVTNSGREIWGEIYTHDSGDQGQDLILRYPMVVIRDTDGSVWKEINAGKYVFISENKISEIYYETELHI